MVLRKYILYVFFISLQVPCLADELIHDSVTMKQIKDGLDHIYDNEFEAARKVLVVLQDKYPEHPVTSLFEGLIYYWKNYPLIPGHTGSSEFEEAMKESWERAERLGEIQEESIESVFFDLTARSFIVMYFADNGIPVKAIGHLRAMYRDIIKGFDLQDEFPEFYFLTGLYNYYREAYIEAYPVYKPVSIFFRKGDKEKGLEMLRFASARSDFLHVEATFFLSLIYMNFESDSDSAVRYAGMLYNAFPGNGSFHSRYAEMLLINKQYDKALQNIRQLLVLDDYDKMKGTIYLGIYYEMKMNDPEKARAYYEEGLKLAGPYGERADYSKAYAYMGLSRYYYRQGDRKKAREYRRKAGNSTAYEYVLSE